MGRCQEFGVVVREGCGHPMTAGESSCACAACGVVCTGKFAGCEMVWANGAGEVLVATGAAAAASGGQDVFGRPATMTTAWPSLEGTQTWSPLDVPLRAKRAATPARPERQASEQGEPAEPLPTVSTAWGSAESQEAEQEAEAPIGAAATQEPAADVDTGPSEPGHQLEAPPSVGAAQARGQVLEWLQESFDGLHARLRVITEAVSRQEEVLTSVSEVDAAAGRLSQLSDTLPSRIGDAVREALRSTSFPIEEGSSPGGGKEVVLADDLRLVLDDALDEIRGHMTAPAEVAEQVRRSLVEAHTSAVALRSEIERLGGPELVPAPPPPARPRPAAQPWPAPLAAAQPSDSGQPPGIRTQLTTLASTIQSRVDRSGWQERLRALRPPTDSRATVSTR